MAQFSPMEEYNDSQLNPVNSQAPGVYITWDRQWAQGGVKEQRIVSATSPGGPWQMVAVVPPFTTEYVDKTGRPTYYYAVQTVDMGSNVVTETTPMPGEELLTYGTIKDQLYDLLHLHVDAEPLVMRADRTWGVTTWRNWNNTPSPEIRISGMINEGDSEPTLELYTQAGVDQTQNGPSPNYSNGLIALPDFNGRVFFVDRDGAPQAVSVYDSITVGYSVSMFSVREMKDALRQALSLINLQPGTMKYTTIGDTPTWYEGILVVGALSILLRGLAVRVLNRETKRLLLDNEKDSSEIRELAKMYQDLFDSYLKVVGKTNYPLTRSIVNNPFPLPGGRSRFFRNAFVSGV